MRASCMSHLRASSGPRSSFLTDLERGRRIDAAVLRARDGELPSAPPTPTGAWNWKTAYDACEAATVLFLRKFGPAMRARAGFAGRDAADAGEDRRPSSHPYPPFRGKRGASAVLDADPAWLRGEHRGGDYPGRPSCWSRRLAPGLLAILAELVGRLARSQRVRRDPRRTSCHFSFRASPSRASTPRISTIISTPASRRASC